MFVCPFDVLNKSFETIYRENHVSVGIKVPFFNANQTATAKVVNIKDAITKNCCIILSTL